MCRVARASETETVEVSDATDVSNVSTPSVTDAEAEFQVVTLSDEEDDVIIMDTTSTSLTTAAQQSQDHETIPSHEGATRENTTSIQDPVMFPPEVTPSSPPSTSQSTPGSSPSTGAQIHARKIGKVNGDDVFEKVGRSESDRVRYELFVSRRQEDISILKRKLENVTEQATKANQQLTQANQQLADTLTKTITEKLETMSETVSSACAKDIAELKELVTKGLDGLKESMLRNQEYMLIELDLAKRNFEDCHRGLKNGQNEILELVKAKNGSKQAGTVETAKQNSAMLNVSQMKTNNLIPAKGQSKEGLLEVYNHLFSPDHPTDEPAPKDVSRSGAKRRGRPPLSSSAHNQKKKRQN